MFIPAYFTHCRIAKKPRFAALSERASKKPFSPEGRTYSISTEYSADGRLLTLCTIHSDGIEWIRRQSYKADGRLAKTVYGNSREPGPESVYSYDGAGRLLSITNSPREGDRIDFHFDEQGGKEAIGIVRAARASGLPVVISFTLETDGSLPTGQSLREAIDAVDAATDKEAAYYMINCVHPTHFDTAIATSEPWVKRLRGIRANASKLSHAELNEAPDLDDGNPRELGGQYADLLCRHPQINVLGGCCGTDHRHIEEIARACKAAS